MNRNQGRKLPEPGELARLLEMAGLRRHKVAGSLLRAALRSEDPTWTNQLLELIDRRLAGVTETHPFGPSPDELPDGEISPGDLLLAGMETAEAVRLPLALFLQNVFISGTIGSGKSGLLFHLCDQLADHARVTVFDREGDAATRLATALRSGKFRCLRYSNLAFNPLRPAPGESAEELRNRLVSYWRSELTLAEGGEALLLQAIQAAQEKREAPTLRDLKGQLDKLGKGLHFRQQGYWDSVANRVSGLLLGLGKVFDHTQGHDLAALLNENLVIDLEGISDTHHRFLVSALLSATLALRERQALPRLNIFAVDELHRMARAGSGESPWPPYMFEAARLGRKRGVGLILADQTPSQWNASLLGNMVTKFAMRTVDGRCKETLARSMGLNGEQREWLGQMPLRTAVMHSLIFPQPMVVAAPELSYGEPLSAAERSALEQEFLRRLGPLPSEDCAPLETQKTQAPKTRNTEPWQELGITKDLLDYLIAVDREPFAPATERDAALGLNDYQGYKRRKELVERGLANLVKVSLGRRGKNLTLVELTPEAYAIFEQLRVKPAAWRGKGSFLHRFWQNHLARTIAAKHPEWKCAVEDASSGKAVDVTVDTGEKRIAIEICVTGIEKEVRNIYRDVGYDEIFMLAQDEETLLKTRARAMECLSSDALQGVWFELLSRFDL